VSKSRKIFSSIILLSGSTSVSQTASFLRNIVLARILTKADFGVAATFSMAIVLFDISSKAAIGTLIVQSKNGSKTEFLNAAHFAQFAIGIVGFIGIFSSANLIAGVFNIPDGEQAIKLLSLILLFKAIEHQEIRRFARELKFFPQAMVETIPQVVITLAAWPLAVWLGDYRAILWILIAKAALSTLLTHFWAKSPYSWNIDKAYHREIFRFSWPLLLNGFLLFAIMHTDKALIGANYSLAELGVYSAAALLCLTPFNLIAQINGSLAIPILSKNQDSLEKFKNDLKIYLEILSLIAVVFATIMIIGGELFVTTVYGTKYEGGGVILACLGIVNAFRICRFASTGAALSRGDTKNALASSVLRATGITITILAALLDAPLWVIGLSGLGGELLALTGSYRRLSKNLGEATWTRMPGIAFLALATAASSVLLYLDIHQFNMLTILLILVAFLTLLVSMHLVLFPSSRKLLLTHSTAKFAQFLQQRSEKV